MAGSTFRGETDESLLHDARARAAAVLDGLRRDAASLADDPRWTEGQHLYAEACKAAERLLVELNAGAAESATAGNTSAAPSERLLP